MAASNLLWRGCGNRAPTLHSPGASLDHQGPKEPSIKYQLPTTSLHKSQNMATMFKHCKDQQQPRKISGFFPSIPKYPQQNGGGASTMWPAWSAGHSQAAPAHPPKAQLNLSSTGTLLPGTKKSKTWMSMGHMYPGKVQGHPEMMPLLPHQGPASIRHHVKRYDAVS